MSSVTHGIHLFSASYFNVLIVEFTIFEKLTNITFLISPWTPCAILRKFWSASFVSDKSKSWYEDLPDTSSSSWLDNDDVFWDLKNRRFSVLAAERLWQGDGLRLLWQDSEECLRWKSVWRKEWLEARWGSTSSGSVIVSSGGFLRFGVERDEERLFSMSSC